MRMRIKQYLTGALLLFATLVGCQKNSFEDTSFATSAADAAQLTALFEITQDNSGLVTITPNGEGAISYEITYGDGTTVPAKVMPGKNTTHTYKEGVYDVKIAAYNVSGKKTEATQKLTVTFKAPENLEVNVVKDAANNYKVNVSAKADFETFFRVYYGDVANEVPVSFLEGQTVSHTYTATGTYNVRIVALSGGVATTEKTVPFVITDPLLLPLTFESATLPYAFTNFDGGNASVVANPVSGGVNTSAKTGKMVKAAGQVWGGSFITLDGNIDFSANKIFRMKVYAPRIGAKVLLKVENSANGGINFEKEVATTVANTWEDMVFDYSAINTANTYNRIVLIFDLGTMGDGTSNFTYYFDDIRLTNTIPSSQINLPVTFDVPGINYTVTDFGNNQTVDATDPNNASNKVKKTTKVNGAETWAGTTIGTPLGFASAIPMSAGSTQMTVRVWSPAAGLKIKLKIEDHNDGNKSVETDVLTTVANGWETLNFDFTNNSAGTPAINYTYNYDKASIFFDFGNAGSGKEFLWDDVIKLSTNVTTSLGLPLDFESSSLTYAWTDFDGGAVTVINNPQSGGINTSAKVAKMVKNAGQVWGGSYITLDNPIDFSTKKTFKMKVYSPRAGAKVLLKVENLNNGGISFEKEVSTTVANGWEELTFDYSTINTANTYQKVVLIFDLGTMGDGTANFTFLFDDINLFN